MSRGKRNAGNKLKTYLGLRKPGAIGDESMKEGVLQGLQAFDESLLTQFKDECGQLDREDGPAWSAPDGSYRWYRRGFIHRIGGPAIELRIREGNEWHWYREWRRYGLFHREDGPAIEILSEDKSEMLFEQYHLADYDGNKILEKSEWKEIMKTRNAAAAAEEELSRLVETKVRPKSRNRLSPLAKN